ncbi:hypothetical protein PLICRDRAFT_174718 [Plicaturopsis crispa FD-325 SS-3]|nr:hypothetical protein PLICRDRAFT_174718 [Plicaturopsis crispa FD-325 SS-3]
MSEDLSSLQADEARLLESALHNSTAFSPAPLPRESATPTKPPGQAVEPAPEVAETGGAPSTAASDDSWKAEYESHVHTWRAQSAEAREKAERERARWEAIRRAEGRPDHGWESVGEGSMPTGIPPLPSPSPADARDLVSGESTRRSTHDAQGPPTSQTSHSRQETGEDSSKLSNSLKWEDIATSDAASSFPSMSFPERSKSASPSAQHPTPAPAPISASLAIFDSSLSPRTRASALLSSLAINMLLPFVNGVMLGFGEIFAKNVIIGWLGWKIPGTPVATTVGVGVPLPADSQRQRRPA